MCFVNAPRSYQKFRDNAGNDKVKGGDRSYRHMHLVGQQQDSRTVGPVAYYNQGKLASYKLDCAHR